MRSVGLTHNFLYLFHIFVTVQVEIVFVVV